MGILLDSANPDEVRRAQELGFLDDVTTNPTLIAQTGRPGLDVLGELVEIVKGHVFYQVTAEDVEARYDEAWEAHEVRPDKVILKIPATIENFALTTRLVQNGIECAITAVTTPAQAYLASQVNASFAIPYVNRLTRQLGDGVAIARDMVRILEPTETEVLAASLKSVDEVVATMLAGVRHVTIPLDLILAMGEHELSQQAITQFNESLKATSSD